MLLFSLYFHKKILYNYFMINNKSIGNMPIITQSETEKEIARKAYVRQCQIFIQETKEILKAKQQIKILENNIINCQNNNDFDQYLISVDRLERLDNDLNSPEQKNNRLKRDEALAQEAWNLRYRKSASFR